MHTTSSTVPEVTVGIDVSKARLDAHVEPSGASRSFDNDKCGRRALRNWACREGAERAALEPTGRFHRELHQCLADAGIEVVVVNPRRTRNFARSIGKEARNDLTDAEVLAVFARLHAARRGVRAQGRDAAAAGGPGGSATQSGGRPGRPAEGFPGILRRREAGA